MRLVTATESAVPADNERTISNTRRAEDSATIPTTTPLVVRTITPMKLRRRNSKKSWFRRFQVTVHPFQLTTRSPAG
jgi:hypothetical protein